MQGNTDNVIFEDGAVLHRKQCEEIFGEWINSIADFSTSLYRMSLDISALACMEALTLITRKFHTHSNGGDSTKFGKFNGYNK